MMALRDGARQEHRDRVLGMPPAQRPVDDEVARGMGGAAFHAWLGGFDVVGEVSFMGEIHPCFLGGGVLRISWLGEKRGGGNPG